MKIIVNGKEKSVRAGSTLKTAISGEPYVKGTPISVHLSEEKVVKETNDFEIQTERGTMVMHLNGSPEADLWRNQVMANMSDGVNARWVTHNIAAFESFPTDLPTYIMIARDNHTGSYGAGKALIGRITVGRHILGLLKEGDRITSVRPMMSETSTENVVVTRDLTMKMEEGYKIDTNVSIDLDEASPESAEHVLVLSSTGTMKATETTGSVVSCSEDLDVKIPVEDTKTRDKGSVAVRNEGLGTGRLYIYKDRRQLTPAINIAGQIATGMAILNNVQAGEEFTVTTNPARLLSVGMTQKAGSEFLESRGVKQVRTGDTSDDAIIVEQSPEHTMTALKAGEVETFGVPKDRVFRIKLSDKDPVSLHYFKKVTGLSHKPVGSIKVQFTFEGLPMVTFYGDEMRGKNLYPQDPFKKVKRGDIGLTNQARPHHGLIGIRLEDSKDFGPTGEEPYGTNIIGKFVDDLDRLMNGLQEEDVVYITEEEL